MAIAVVLWSGSWAAARLEVIRRMDGAVARLQSVGYDISWKQRTVGGFPFRLDIALSDFRGRSPGGWGFETGRLEGEAFMHAPDHWVFAAPMGMSLLRPAGGPVDVTGSTIHASLHGLSVRPPSFSFEGLDLQFSARDNSRPFVLSGAGKVELHLRPGPDRQGAFLFRISDGQASLPGLLGRIAGTQPVNLQLEAILSRADALKGAGWTQAMRAWARAGGRAMLRSARASAGPALIEASPAEITLGPDGRLSGQLEVNLRKAPEALNDLGAQGLVPKDAAAAAAAQNGLAAHAVLQFRDGATYLGPIRIGPSPGLF